MYKIGLKLWSTNKHYAAEAQRLFDQGFCDYIELYAYPNSYDECAGVWRALSIPFIIHAPHLNQGGINFAQQSYAAQNQAWMAEVLKFADALHASTIILHPGIDGDIQETIKQLQRINDSRLYVENHPYYALDGVTLCNGSTPEEMCLIIESVGIQFCFDVGHAIYAANALKKNKIDYVRQFLALNPGMFHVTGGDWHGVIDQHDHLYKGSFQLNEILSLLPTDAMITIESAHDYQDSLRDFEDDVAYLKNITRQKVDLCRTEFLP